MIPEIFCICDSASSEKGVLTVNDVYNVLPCPGFPAIIQALTIAVRLRFSLVEKGTHSFRITVSDLDNRLAGQPVEGSFDVLSDDDPAHSWVWQSVVVQLPNMRFSEPNDYTVTLQIDGESIAHTILCMKRL